MVGRQRVSELRKTRVRGAEEPGAEAQLPGQCRTDQGLSWCLAEAAYKRTLSVDGEETTLLVMNTWEPEQPVQWGRGCWDVPGGDIGWA